MAYIGKYARYKSQVADMPRLTNGETPDQRAKLVQERGMPPELHPRAKQAQALKRLQEKFAK